MDPKILNEIDGFVKEKLRDTSSVLIIRNGYIVFEKYYIGEASEQRSLYSCTKSIISILTGIALKDGLIKSIDDKMVDYLPESITGDIDPEVARITIRNLLNMSAGFSDDGGVGSSTLTGMKIRLSMSPTTTPGTEFAYNGNCPNLLSIIIEKASGMKAEEYAKNRLFDPLGIQEKTWISSLEFTNGAYGLALTTRDMAKIGYLYLKNGNWQGKKIVSKDWVNKSVKKPIELPASIKTGDERYGFFWWVFTIASHEVFSAVGYNGQYILVAPKLNLVAAITGISGGGSVDRTPIVGDYVIRAVSK